MMATTKKLTRSIGDVYLKKPKFNRAPLHIKFGLQETLRRPPLSSDPAITVHQIEPTDKFIIFPSNGLWEQLRRWIEFPFFSSVLALEANVKQWEICILLLDKLRRAIFLLCLVEILVM